MTFISKMNFTEQIDIITKIVRCILDNEFTMDVSTKLLLGFKCNFNKCLPNDTPVSNTLSARILYIYVLLTNVETNDLKIFVTKNQAELLKVFYLEYYEKFLQVIWYVNNVQIIEKNYADQKKIQEISKQKNCSELTNFNNGRFYSELVLLIDVAEYLIGNGILPKETNFLDVISKLLIIIKFPNKVDHSYLIKLRRLLENLIKNDQIKSRQLIAFCLEHLKLIKPSNINTQSKTQNTTIQVTDKTTYEVLTIFDFVIGCQVLFECLDKIEEYEISNILIQMNPSEKDISNIFDNLCKFISGSNSLISIFAGLLDFLNTSQKELVRKYI